MLYRLDDVQYQAALESAKAAVMQAQAESLYAERDYKRQQALYEQKASSRDVLDAAERTAKTSAAALASAKAALITAEDNLKHCVIAAPMDGRMSFTNYSAGSYVTAAGSASTTLATLVSVSPVRVRAALSMKDITGLFGSIAELQNRPLCRRNFRTDPSFRKSAASPRSTTLLTRRPIRSMPLRNLRILSAVSFREAR